MRSFAERNFRKMQQYDQVTAFGMFFFFRKGDIIHEYCPRETIFTSEYCPRGLDSLVPRDSSK